LASTQKVAKSLFESRYRIALQCL